MLVLQSYIFSVLPSSKILFAAPVSITENAAKDKYDSWNQPIQRSQSKFQSMLPTRVDLPPTGENGFTVRLIPSVFFLSSMILFVFSLHCTCLVA